MPYTVAVSFDKFYEAINLPGEHRTKANSRRDEVIKILKNRFDILEAFPSGSIPRFTALKANADLDVMVVLHYSKHIKNRLPSSVLQEVRDALAEHKTNVRKNGQAITLYYKTWPNVDIVPCSKSSENGITKSYSIPNMNTESWITSKPKTHSEKIKSMASEKGQNFRKIITMIKHWNKTHSNLLQSYHIECMAINIYSEPMDTISWDIFKYFKEATKLIRTGLYYNGASVDSYLNWEKKYEIIRRLETASTQARDAWYDTLPPNNDHESAITKWKNIFGDKFPAYG